MSSLDARKAYNRMNHVKLFDKLIDRGFPSMLMNVLLDWYVKTFSIVKWAGCYSRCISVSSGIQQGGILSPLLFNIYIDSLIHALRVSDLGCHLGHMYVGTLVALHMLMTLYYYQPH